MRRVNPWIINASTGLALVAGGLWFAPRMMDVSTWSIIPQQTAESLSTVGLSVEEVLVLGRQHTDAADILDALGAVRGTPILDIDVPAAKARISALPWVRSAEIVRQLPNSLHITLDEYQAFALWQHDARYTLIDKDGTAIVDVATASPDMPMVVGTDAPAHTKALFEALNEQPELQQRVKAAVRFGGRRWDILLDAIEGGITVKLPEANVTDALAGLVKLNAEHQLLNRAVSEIDMRVEGHLVVQLKDGYAPVPQQSLYSPSERDVHTDARAVPTKELAKGV